MKKRLALVLIGAMMVSTWMTACGKKSEVTKSAEESTETENAGTGEDSAESEEEKSEGIVGILAPYEETAADAHKDELKMKDELSQLGYETEILYAGGDAKLQQEQIRDFLEKGVQAIVVTPADPYALSEVLREAKEASIPVFDYDTLIMDTDALSYYVTFNSRRVGQMVGENIRENMKLQERRENQQSCTIEFLMGDPTKVDELFFYNGVMEILQEYMEDGTLVCRSERTEFDEVALTRTDRDQVTSYLEDLLDESYAEEKPDILVTASDEYAVCAAEVFEKREAAEPEQAEESETSVGLQGTKADTSTAAEPAAEPTEESAETEATTETIETDAEPAAEDADAKEAIENESAFPYITTVNVSAEAAQKIVLGEVQMTVLMDRTNLAEQMVRTLDTVLKGETPEVSDYEQYDNGVRIIKTITVDPMVIDGNNYQFLVDGGYYTEEEIIPSPTATPTPEPTATPTPTPTATPTPEPTATPTPAPTNTPTPSPTDTPTPEPTATPTNTPEPTEESEEEPTKTPEETQTPEPTKA